MHDELVRVSLPVITISCLELNSSVLEVNENVTIAGGFCQVGDDAAPVRTSRRGGVDGAVVLFLRHFSLDVAGDCLWGATC